MERREDVRFPAQIGVQFTILGGTPEHWLGWVRDISDGGLRLGTQEPLEPGSFIRIELDDTILFGEVRYSCPWMGGSVAGIRVEQVLAGDSDLSKLVAYHLHTTADPQTFQDPA